MGDAILALGGQSGVSIGVTDSALAASRVPAVRGRLTVEQALARLLANSEARFVRVGAGSYRIVRRPAVRPPQLRIARRPITPPITFAAAPGQEAADGNRRNIIKSQILYRLLPRAHLPMPTFRIGLAYTYDNTRDFSAFLRT